MINENIEVSERNCLEIKAQYDKNSHLWNTDMQVFFSKFVNDAVYVTENGLKLLDLRKFEDEINRYESARESIMSYPSQVDVGWIRINTQPIKSQLITWTNKWTEIFTNHLKNDLTEKLTTLSLFIEEVTKGLDVEVNDTKDGKEALMVVMEVIRDVRKAMETTTEMFKPLQDALVTLKAHGYDLSTLPKIHDKTLQDFLGKHGD